MHRRNFLWYSLLFMAGCTTATTELNTQSTQTDATIPDRLRFAVTDAKGMADLQRDYEPFRIALEEVLETSIQFFPVESYFTAATALQLNEVDLVWSGPSEYVVIHSRTNALPLVAINRPEYYTVVVVRGDSVIQSLADLKGKTIDLRKNGSTVSHIGGIKLLMDAGLNPGSDFEVIFSKDYTLNSLRNGEADAWAIGFYRYQPALEKANASENDYPIIAKGNLLPSDLLIGSSYLDSEVLNYISSQVLDNQQKLLDAILSVESLALRFQGASIKTTNDRDYEMIREVYRAIGQGDFLEASS